MKQNSKYNNLTKFSNQDLEKIIKISQNSNNNIINLKQTEILQRSLDLLYPGQDKTKIIEKMMLSENNIIYNNYHKNDDYSTQPKSTKNIDYDSMNTQSKSFKSNENTFKKAGISKRSLTPKSLTKATHFVSKSSKAKANLNKSVSHRENSKLRDSLNKSSITYQDNGKTYSNLVKTLESLINEIKYYGFDKTKQEINDKLKTRQILEANIENLQRKKTSIYIESKQLITNQSKIVNETHVFHNKGEVI